MVDPFSTGSGRLFPVVRYSYYAFIFSIPIETLDIGIEGGVFSISKVIGILFIATALLQPQVCFRNPPRPFWYFLAYILVWASLATFQPPQLMGLIAIQLFTLILMLILFWVSYNLLQEKSLVKGAFLSMVGSCALLASLVLIGFGQGIAQGRVTAMSHNANMLGATLSLGLLALLGLAYGRNDMDGRSRALLWICSGGIGVVLVGTGSRSAMLGLLGGIFLLAARRGNFGLKVKVGLISLLAIAALVWASYDNDAVRIRWERTLLTGDQSGREEIHPQAWNMFMEKPFFGWGPVSNYVELGARFGKPTMDAHSLYLWIMTETGLLGTIPFFIGLWICWRTAWRATYGTEGSFPIALLGCLLIVSTAGSLQHRKLFWVILAYSLAGEPFLSKRWRLGYPAGPIEEIPNPGVYGLHKP